ncbi:MAG: Hpt domain-containing protein [Candidatus Accumulibacter delftensis]
MRNCASKSPNISRPCKKTAIWWATRTADHRSSNCCRCSPPLATPAHSSTRRWPRSSRKPPRHHSPRLKRSSSHRPPARRSTPKSWKFSLPRREEVLASIDHNFQLLKTQPQETELLTAIRRAVHTLKGSGRMVGLRDFGEAAWSVEQVLNLWLRQEHEVTPAIIDLLGQTYSVFVLWVEHLKTGHVQAPDATE